VKSKEGERMKNRYVVGHADKDDKYLFVRNHVYGTINYMHLYTFKEAKQNKCMGQKIYRIGEVKVKKGKGSEKLWVCPKAKGCKERCEYLHVVDHSVPHKHTAFCKDLAGACSPCIPLPGKPEGEKCPDCEGNGKVEIECDLCAGTGVKQSIMIDGTPNNGSGKKPDSVGDDIDITVETYLLNMAEYGIEATKKSIVKYIRELLGGGVK